MSSGFALIHTQKGQKELRADGAVEMMEVSTSSTRWKTGWAGARRLTPACSRSTPASEGELSIFCVSAQGGNRRLAFRFWKTYSCNLVLDRTGSLRNFGGHSVHCLSAVSHWGEWVVTALF